MLIQRQNNFMLAKDYPTDIVDAKRFLWQFRDIEPRNKLKIEEGLVSEGDCLLTGSQTYAAPLPINYDPDYFLSFFVVSNFPILVTVTRNPSTSSNYLYCYGTNSETEGQHFGHLTFQDKNITGVTFRNVVGANTAQIAWFMFQMPVLTETASWKDGVQTLGVIP